MLGSLSTEALIMSAAIVAIAYFVRGIAGFGSGLIAIPLLALSMPLPIIVPAIVALDYAASASHGVSNRSAIAWRAIWPLLPFTVVGVAIALYLFRQVDGATLKQAMAVFIIGYAIYSLAVKALPPSQNRLWAVPAGSLGGFVGTLFGTGGPCYVIYLQLRGLEKTAFRATFATIFLLDGAGRITGYLLSGLVTVDALAFAALMLPVMIIGLYAGGHVHTNISQDTFKRAISILLIASGLVLLLR